MAAFAAGEADVLVATSVIEVGIDVPNATVMLVEDADRYGISQLHQLRGRIGRGEHASLCLLFGPKDSRAAAGAGRAQRRLRLAEIDLELRGEGELVGTRQHGLAQFRSPSCRATRSCSSARARARERDRRTSDPGARRRPSTRCSPMRSPSAFGAEARGADPGLSRAASMRVIAGRYGGRRCVAPAGDGDPARPSDRVREALFSILGDGRRRAGARPVRRARARWRSRRSRAGRPRRRWSTRAPAAIAAIRRNLEALGARGRGAPPGRAARSSSAHERRSASIRSGLPRPPIPPGERARTSELSVRWRRCSHRRPGRRRERPPRPAARSNCRCSTSAATATP